MAQPKSKSKPKAAKPERAVVTCMDYRVKESVILNQLGWAQSGAYFIRNAGGSVTEDVIRSLMLLQKFVLENPPGTPPGSGRGTYDIEIAVITHTECGMQSPDEERTSIEDKSRKTFGSVRRPPSRSRLFSTPNWGYAARSSDCALAGSCRPGRRKD